ncbi:MAG: ubiquinol-cytochrome c reductase iron-sulfur subunit [Deltaproteobacteria bacterium]|jgi:Rieske Fe-S protein|nr:ubiquinol-cytochrome c reductase iron-sulfur subunit [Deltaproteobacteria bacterium]
METEPKVDRRKFMEIGIYTITGTIAATSSVALARFAIGNSFEKQKAKWIEFEFDENPDEGFSRVVLEYTKKDGWLTADARSLVYIKRTSEDTFVAISATCSHLGCIVTWDEDEKQFKCPCHNGVYDLEGKVVSGPPPAPLRRHKTRIEDGTLLVSTATIAYGEDFNESV